MRRPSSNPFDWSFQLQEGTLLNARGDLSSNSGIDHALVDHDRSACTVHTFEDRLPIPGINGPQINELDTDIEILFGSSNRSRAEIQGLTV